MSDLLQQRADFDAEISRVVTDPDRRSELMSSYVGTVNRFETDYRATRLNSAVGIRRRPGLSDLMRLSAVYHLTRVARDEPGRRAMDQDRLRG